MNIDIHFLEGAVLAEALAKCKLRYKNEIRGVDAFSWRITVWVWDTHVAMPIDFPCKIEFQQNYTVYANDRWIRVCQWKGST